MTSLRQRPGWLTLAGSAASLDDAEPAFVGRRQQHHRCRFGTLVEAEGETEAGLVVRMDQASHYEVAVTGARVIARARVGPLCSIVAEGSRPSNQVVLWIEMDRHPQGPDLVRLGFENDTGELQVLAELDGRYLSTEVSGGFTGRVLGLYAVGGQGAFAWADYQGLE
jgi:xylan 1,4-beta-xylosidase